MHLTNHTTDRLRIKLSRTAGCFDVIDPANGDGWHGLQFYMRCGDTEHRPTVFTGAKTRDGKSQWQIEVAPKVQVHFEAGPSPAGGGMWLRPTLMNRSSQAYAFTGYGVAPALTAPGPRLGHRGLTVFAHAENLRYENLPISQPSFPFIRPLPPGGRWFGRQGQGPIPALVLGKDTQDRWLVEGGASQMKATISWYLGLPTRPGRMLDYGCEYFWNGGTQDCVAPGESVALESWLYLIVNAKPDQIYLAYMEELARLYGDRFAGTTSRLATEAVYTTCNYGIYTKITEADCVKRIKQLGKLQGGIFQIDHGFQPPHQEQLSRGYLDAFYPNPGESWDPRRFPGGPKRIVEVSRQHGLTPAIWWTPRMEVDGPIARAHPDWIAVNRQGNPIEHVGDLHPDYSVAAVREFIEKNIRTIVHDWGFEGIKLDFFSWAFDASDLAYRHGGTSVQWRRWLLEMIRRELGPRGYFLYCISCPLGNPFLALDACDSFRTGMDIDRGEWSHHVAGCSWLLASFPACGRRSWFVDIDSFMGSAGCPVHERRFRCAVGYLTSGMLDFSGPIETLDKLALSDYRRLCQRCDQGGTVRVPDREAFFGVPLPRILVRLHSADSITRRKHGVQATVGLFNWQEAACISGVSLAGLGLKMRAASVRDFWTARPIRVADGRLNVELPPRHHVMVDIMA